jgi:hypothetical protein
VKDPICEWNQSDVVAIEHNVMTVYDEDVEQEYVAIGRPEVHKVGKMFQILS